MIGKVTANVDVRGPVDAVFAAMVDLASQDRWILATKLFALDGDVAVPAVGSRIAALTGIGGVGVLDTMTVTVFDPPHRWETVHTGRAFRGIGIFGVEHGPLGAIATWSEEVELPLGVIGGLGWKIAGPVVRLALTASLRRLAKGVVEGSLPVTRPLTGRSPAPPEQLT